MDGIFAKTTDLFNSIHLLLRETEKLRGQRRDEEASQLGDAALSLLSALVARGLRQPFVTLSERVRRNYEIVMEHASDNQLDIRKCRSHIWHTN